MRLAFAMLFILFSCGQDPQVEDYSMSVLANLSLDNHYHGFGKRQCFNCHVSTNIHKIDRLGTGLLNLAKQVAKDQGVQGCSMCHGTNGVN